MVNGAQVVRQTLTRFLPSVVVVMLVAISAEPLIRRHDLLTSLKALYLPLVIGEPLLMALGYAAALWLVRRQISAQRIATTSRHIAASVVSIVCLGITSVFSQGAHMPFIFSASISAGVVSALLFFAFRSSPPATATTASHVAAA
jgi:hypothetical protein